MLTYTSRRNLFGDLANNSSSATLTLADTLMNISERQIIAGRDWPFLEKQYTLTTVADQQDYVLPPYTKKPESVYITVGSYRYVPREVTLRTQWDNLNLTTVESDIPTHYFVYDGNISFYPTPSTAGKTITINARRIFKDLTQADYTTGTVDIITNGDETVTGSGTTWTTPMVGRWLKVTPTDVAATSGDGVWYEIASRTSATVVELVRKYGGTSLTTGAAAGYIIGEVGLLPETYQQVPVFDALGVYFTAHKPDKEKAQLYKTMANDLRGQMFREFASMESVVLDPDNSNELVVQNPNLYITG